MSLMVLHAQTAMLVDSGKAAVYRFITADKCREIARDLPLWQPYSDRGIDGAVALVFVSFDGTESAASVALLETGETLEEGIADLIAGLRADPPEDDILLAAVAWVSPKIAVLTAEDAPEPEDFDPYAASREFEESGGTGAMIAMADDSFIMASFDAGGHPELLGSTSEVAHVSSYFPMQGHPFNAASRAPDQLLRTAVAEAIALPEGS